jgi:hypothetical protein
MAQLRPRAEYLQSLPTLAVETPEAAVSEAVREYTRHYGVVFRLELKLVTTERRYWLCTQGLPPGTVQPGSELESWTVGFVTIDPLQPDEAGGCWRCAYGPDSASFLQGLDYLAMLYVERECLKRLNEKDFTWETVRQLDATQAEIERVIASLRQDCRREPTGNGG